MSIQPILDRINDLFDKLNSTSIKRLVIYAMLLYPLALMHYYQDELKLIFNDYYDENVQLTKLADVQGRCFELKGQYGASAVILYVYQPKTKHKTYKERIVSSISNQFTPLEKNRNIYLSSRTRIIEEMKNNKYAKITGYSNHHESSIVIANNLNTIFFTPVYDLDSNAIIGEVMWVFKEPLEVDPMDLVNEGQYFAFNIDN